MKNGESMSAESKEKMIRTKHEQHIRQLIDTSIPEASDQQLVVPSHRKKVRFSTINEYQDILKKTGWTQLEFAKNGYAKNQVAFFNYLLKGKLSITKEQFVEEYQQNHLELVEIAGKYGIPEDYIAQIREHFGIKRIGATGLKRAKDTKPLSNRQREIAYGSMMGDACVDKQGCLRIKHGGPQSAYTECLAKEFLEHCKGNNPIDYANYFDERFGRFVESHTLRTRTHREFKAMRRIFYRGSTKIVTPEILSNISELGLAIWYMDDGFSDFIFDVSGNAKSAECRFYTCGFTAEECNIIRIWLKEKWDLSTWFGFKLPSEERNPFITISMFDAFRFLDLVRPHVYDCMDYKVDAKEWLKWRASKGNFAVFGYHGKVGAVDTEGNFTPIPV